MSRIREQFEKESGFNVAEDGHLNNAIYWIYIVWLESKLEKHEQRIQEHIEYVSSPKRK